MLNVYKNFFKTYVLKFNLFWSQEKFIAFQKQGIFFLEKHATTLKLKNVSFNLLTVFTNDRFLKVILILSFSSIVPLLIMFKKNVISVVWNKLFGLTKTKHLSKVYDLNTFLNYKTKNFYYSYSNVILKKKKIRISQLNYKTLCYSNKITKETTKVLCWSQHKTNVWGFLYPLFETSVGELGVFTNNVQFFKNNKKQTVPLVIKYIPKENFNTFFLKLWASSKHTKGCVNGARLAKQHLLYSYSAGQYKKIYYTKFLKKKN